MANSESDKVGVHDIFETCNSDIRWAKNQQWTIGYYVILIYAGLFGVLHVGMRPEQLLWVKTGHAIAVLAILVACIGLEYHIALEYFLMERRKRLNTIYTIKSASNPNECKYATLGFTDVRGPQTSERAREFTAFMRNPEVALAILAPELVGALIVVNYSVAGSGPNTLGFYIVLGIALLLLTYLSARHRRESKLSTQRI